MLFRSDDGDDLVSKWMRDLFAMYQQQDMDPEYRHRVQGRDARDYDDYIRQLGRSGDTFWTLISRHEKRKSAIEWALKVVHCEVFALADQTDRSLTRHCMYMRPWMSDRSDEKWTFEDVAVMGQEPEGEPDIAVFQHKFN